MKTIVLLSTLSVLLFANRADDAIAQMKAEFEHSKQQQQQEFLSYKEALNKEYETYKKSLLKYWRDPKLSTQKEWISYSKDGKSRSDVDFKNNRYTVEVIAPDLVTAKKRISKRIAYVVSKNTKEVVSSDPLQKKVAQLSHSSKDVVSAPIQAKQILAPVVFQKQPTQKDIHLYVKQTLQKEPIQTKTAKNEKEKVYKIVVNLPKDSSIKLSQTYQKEVARNSHTFKLPFELIFAIMQTESDFNPFAKSHVPAFGLMQIVPRTAGRDTYRFLYNKDKMPSATYLYNSKNNIQMGTGYLHILYYKYLKKIKNPTSRLYCTIAAYNTGAGNIAWAFTRTYNVNKAAPIINGLSPDAVYAHLLSDLRFNEPKNYLIRVHKRMKIYKEVYKSL